MFPVYLNYFTPYLLFIFISFFILKYQFKRKIINQYLLFGIISLLAFGFHLINGSLENRITIVNKIRSIDVEEIEEIFFYKNGQKILVDSNNYSDLIGRLVFTRNYYPVSQSVIEVVVLNIILKDSNLKMEVSKTNNTGVIVIPISEKGSFIGHFRNDRLVNCDYLF